MTAAEGCVTKEWTAMLRSSELTAGTSVTKRTRTKRGVKAQPRRGLQP